MRSFSITALVAAALLAACASPYKVSEQHVAKVRFRTEAAAWVNVSTFANEKCAANPDGEKLGAVGHGSHFSLVPAQPNEFGMLDEESPSTKRIERVVRAGRPFYFAFEHAYVSRPGVGCNRTLSFVPEAGAQYEAEFLLSGGRCDARVSRLEPTGSGAARRIPEKSMRTYNNACRVQRAFNSNLH